MISVLRSLHDLCLQFTFLGYAASSSAAGESPLGSSSFALDLPCSRKRRHSRHTMHRSRSYTFPPYKSSSISNLNRVSAKVTDWKLNEFSIWLLKSKTRLVSRTASDLVMLNFVYNKFE